MKIYLRLGEESKSERQKEWRQKTYDAAKTLRSMGIQCEVTEQWTGDNIELCPASIQLIFKE